MPHPGRLPTIILAAAIVMLGCEGPPKPVGQLVVSIETDMALPDQVDTIRVQVLVRGQPLLDIPYEVGSGPDTQAIPATLTLLAGNDPSQPVTIRVQGVKDRVARTLREAVTTVPKERTAHLRMPVQWLCDGSAKTVSGRGAEATVVSSCGDGATCAAGVCVPNKVKSEMLPSYEPKEVFGGGSGPGTGLCFDTLPCMIGGSVATPDGDCTIEKPVGGNGVNVALRVVGQGICDATGNTCFVPLDGASEDGFQEREGRLQLPVAACEKLQRGVITALITSTQCVTKTAATPACGSWSSVRSVPDAGQSNIGETPAPPPTPTLVATLTKAKTSLCCPLLADEKQLYTCTCGGSDLNVLAIDAKGDKPPASIASLMQREVRGRVSAVMSAGSLYWTDRGLADAGSLLSRVERTVLAEDVTMTLAQVDGDIYDDSVFLADATSLFVLADNVRDAAGAVVQILRIERASGRVTPLDTGSQGPVFQFAQDASALYVASYTAAGDQQTSRVARIDKLTGSLTSLDQQTVDKTRNATGYVALAADDSAVYGLFQTDSQAGFEVQLIKIETKGGKKSSLQRWLIDPSSVSYQILGVVDGFVLLARSQASASDGGLATRTGASLIAVKAAGGPAHVIVDFVRDGPVGGVLAPSFDKQNLYWLNASGGLYRYPRAGLE